jgi:ABC-type ATPase involved in cell division
MIEIPEHIDIDNPEFQDDLQLIQYTSSSVYLTGRAGTGKSTFLRYVCNNTHKKHIVLAPMIRICPPKTDAYTTS